MCVRKRRFAVPTVDQVIVWIVVGLIGGSLAGLIVKRDREGFGIMRNLGLGLAGALVGGLLFRLFRLWPGLDQIAISLRDVVAAFIGSIAVNAFIAYRGPRPAWPGLSMLLAAVGFGLAATAVWG